MSFTLLPQKNEKKRDYNPNQYLTLEQNQDIGQSTFIHKSLVLILAFVLPTIILLFTMALLGFAPFGKKCMFLAEGLSQKFSLITLIQSTLKSGSFSVISPLFTSEGFLYSFLYHFSNPFRFLSLFLPAEASILYLQLTVVFEIGLSGFFFCYYLTHRHYGHKYDSNDFSILLFSTSYALSSFMLVRYNDLVLLDLAAMFPLIIVSFENLIFENKAKTFRVIICISFILQYYTAAMTLLLLFIYILFMECDSLTVLFERLLRYLYNCFICILLTAALVLPGFWLFYHCEAVNTTMPNFSFATDFWTFFSKFLPGGFADAAVDTLSHGTNLYMGLFVFFLLPIYFFSKKITAKSKCHNFLFLLFLALSISQSQTQYICRLFNGSPSSYNGYAFVFIFFVLSICANSLYQYQNTPKIYLGISLLILPALYFLMVQYAKGYIRQTSIHISMIFISLYIIYLILYFIKSITPVTFYGLLLLTTIIELSCNTVTLFQDTAKEALNVTDCIPVTSHFPAASLTPFDLPLNDMTVPEYFLVDSYDKSALTDVGSSFDMQNGIAKAVGCQDALFSNTALKIECAKIPDEINYRIFDNQILSIGLKSLTGKENMDTFIKNNTQTLSITLSITPKESGDLYLYIDDFIHIGNVTKGVSFNYEYDFAYSYLHYSNFQIQSALLNHDVLREAFSLMPTCHPDIQRYSPFSMVLANKFENDGLFVTNIPYSKYLTATIDGETVTLEESTCGTAALPVTSGLHNIKFGFNFPALILGIVISLLSILSLCLSRIQLCKTAYNTFALRWHMIIKKVTGYIYTHKYAFLSFLFPLNALFLGGFISGSTPFGENSWLKNDGFVLTYAMLLQRRHELLNGNILYSWTMGSGTNIFNSMPNTLLSAWLILVPEKHLFNVVSVFEMIKIALCGTSMYYYLSRKKIANASNLHSGYTLVLSSAYSLSAFALNMHDYFHWTNVLILLPLIIGAFDHFMKKKNPFIYILLLALSIIYDYNTSLFVCIFLCFWFFTYSFDSFRDFVKKGLLFASSSLLSVGMSFWVLFALISNLQISPYAADDSVIPTLKFYQSFWDTFKQSFLFSKLVSITPSNGAINLYCGIFVILLFFLGLFKTKKTKALYVKLFIVVFLIISSNNELLTYIWNGFHYPIMVPNRYSFLFVFVLIDLALETLHELTFFKTWQFIASHIAFIMFFVLTTVLSEETPSKNSVVFSALFAIGYVSFILLARIKPIHKRLIQKAFLTLSLIELTLHTCGYFVSLHIAEDISYYAANVTTHLKQHHLSENALERVNCIFPYTTNTETINNVGSVNQFNSYLTKYQYQMGKLNGTYIATNLLRAEHNQTPFGNAISNIQYVLYDHYTTTNNINLDAYEVIDYYNQCVYLKNNRALSPAFYLPKEIPEKISEITNHCGYANLLCQSLDMKEMIFTDFMPLLPKETMPTDPSADYLFLTSNDNNQAANSTVYNHKIHFTAKKSGDYYYCADENIYLGKLTEGQEYTFNIPSNVELGFLTVYHDDIMQEFYDILTPYTFHTTNQTNTCLEGTITLPEDGIINFSIPYEPGWRAYLDGTEVETKALGDAYLYIDAPKGKHRVTLKFFPVSLPFGVGVTVASWGIYIIIFFIHRKKAVDKHQNDK